MKDIPFMRSLFFQFEFETSANEPRQTNHAKRTTPNEPRKGLSHEAAVLFYY